MVATIVININVDDEGGYDPFGDYKYQCYLDDWLQIYLQ